MVFEKSGIRVEVEQSGIRAEWFSSRGLTNVVYASLRSLMSLVTQLQKMIPILDCALHVTALM